MTFDRRNHITSLLCLLGLLIAGCSNQDTPTVSPTIDQPSQTQESTLTITASPTQRELTPTITPSPTRQETTPTPTKSNLKPSLIPRTPNPTPTVDTREYTLFSEQGVHFTTHPDLGDVYSQEVSLNDGQINYLRFSFAPEGDCESGGCLEIYPVEQFKAVYDRFVFPPAGYGGGAAILMDAREETIDFNSGSGTRTLETHGQMGYFAHNGALKYIFRGYTADQAYGIYLEYPIQTSILLSAEAAFDPAANTNPLALPVPTASPDDARGTTLAGYNVVAYNQLVSQQLDTLKPDDFTPSLDILDTLVASLQIEEKSAPRFSTCPTSDSAWSSPFQLIPGQSVIEIFASQIQDYLNICNGPAELETALAGPFMGDSENYIGRAQVSEVDVTGDTQPEVVVDFGLLVSVEYSDGAIFVYNKQADGYQLLAAEPLSGFILGSVGPEPGIRAIQDLNADGVPEVVLSYVPIVGTHINYGRVFEILTWDGQQFVDLLDGSAEVQNGDGWIDDQDSDGFYKLVLEHGLGRGPDVNALDRPHTDFWEWDGKAFRFSYSQVTTPPIFRIHAIWDGDEATRTHDYDLALDFYQQAIFDEELLGWSSDRDPSDAAYTGSATPTPDVNEWPRLAAYGRYRILLLHAFNGYLSDAQIVYDTLQEKFPPTSPGEAYAALATVFWNEFVQSQDISVACQAAIDYTQSNTDQVLSPLGDSFYGAGQPHYLPQDICPFLEQ